MPSEQPNENMDKALKALAEKRREDSVQIELDLATRRMLQAEVARTLGKVPVQAKSRPRFVFWPQVIMGVACAAALAVAVLLWKLPPESRSKASTDSAVEYQKPTALSTPAVTTDSAGVVAQQPAPSVALEKKSVDEPLHLSLKTDAPRRDSDSILSHSALAKQSEVASSTADKDSAHASDSTMTIVPAQPQPQNSTRSAQGFVASPATVASAAAPSVAAASPVPSGQVALKDSRTEVAPNQQLAQVITSRQRFSQVDSRMQYRRNFNSPPLTKVLTNFDVQRNGSNVLVVDADGSTYSGNIVAGTGAEQSRSKQFGIRTVTGPAVNGAVPNNSEGAAQDAFAFRVSGYNSRLRQKVVFTGSVTNALVGTNGVDTNGTQQSISSSQNSNAQQALPQNVLLNGRVQVGRNSEFDIQAAPTK